MVNGCQTLVLLLSGALLIFGQANAQTKKDQPQKKKVTANQHEIKGMKSLRGLGKTPSTKVPNGKLVTNFSAAPSISLVLTQATAFKEWSKNKVPNTIVKKTYLGFLSKPIKTNVNHIIFIAAGQQAFSPADIYNDDDKPSNVLTGQYRDYKAHCVDKFSLCRVKINNDSLAGRIYNNPMQFPRSKTLIILVLDSQFKHNSSDNVKRKIENAYWGLITSRVDAGKLKSISLAGSSKGGCLSFALAKRFRNHDSYNKIPLILHGLDPVCKKDRLLPSAAKQYFDNPLEAQAKYKSLEVDMGRVFPANARSHLAILNIHSGAPIVDLGNKASYAHSFTYKPTDIDLGWWKQTWAPLSHKDLTSNHSNNSQTVIPAYKHLLKYKNRFSDYLPTGVVTSNQNKKCPTLFPKKIGDKNAKPICTAHMPVKIRYEKCTHRNAPGQIWSAKYCIWNKGNYWHARPVSKPLKCPVVGFKKVSEYSNKPVCIGIAALKIKEKKCGGSRKTFVGTSYCMWNKGSYYKVRKIK